MMLGASTASSSQSERPDAYCRMRRKAPATSDASTAVRSRRSPAPVRSAAGGAAAGARVAAGRISVMMMRRSGRREWRKRRGAGGKASGSRVQPDRGSAVRDHAGGEADLAAVVRGGRRALGQAGAVGDAGVVGPGVVL